MYKKKYMALSSLRDIFESGVSNGFTSLFLGYQLQDGGLILDKW